MRPFWIELRCNRGVNKKKTDRIVWSLNSMSATTFAPRPSPPSLFLCFINGTMRINDKTYFTISSEWICFVFVLCLIFFHRYLVLVFVCWFGRGGNNKTQVICHSDAFNKSWLLPFFTSLSLSVCVCSNVWQRNQKLNEIYCCDAVIKLLNGYLFVHFRHSNFGRHTHTHNNRSNARISHHDAEKTRKKKNKKKRESEDPGINESAFEWFLSR